MTSVYTNGRELLKINPHSTQWRQHIRNAFANYPIRALLHEILGASCMIATSFYFGNSGKISSQNFLYGSWNCGGFDNNDWERIKSIYSEIIMGRKGLSFAAKGLRCVIFNFYTDIDNIENIESLDYNGTLFLSRHPTTEDGNIICFKIT